MSLFVNKKVFYVVLITLCAATLMVKSEDFSADNVLETIFSPNQPSSIQVQALRRDLLRRLTEALENEENEADAWKRSISSLARWNNLPQKKSLESLARGGYLRPRSVEGDPSSKRSISTLAKNGQLPNYQSGSLEKRGIQSLARNGDLQRKRETQELLSDLNEKRYLGSLARNYNLPSYGKRSYYYYDGDDKRSIASLARAGMKINGKREAIGDGEVQKRYFITGLINENAKVDDKEVKNGDAGKRNPVDVGRKKRDADYYDDEYSSPVYQNQNENDVDYEQLLKELVDEYPNPEKRFLGRLPQMGKVKTTPSPKMRFH